MESKFSYIPKEERKKILLICDDIRVHSGVATVAREIVQKTCHHFNWVNQGGAIKHPDAGKTLDLSGEAGKLAGIEDASVKIIPTNGYGDETILRKLLKEEKPDAIMLITDPRYFMWLFNIEHEIRKNIPITYLNIWDDYPAPMYNSAYYEACDLLMGISKQTVNINRIVLGDKAENKILRYIPHGLDTNVYKPVADDDKELVKFRKEFFNNENPEFVVFFNSRNIRRKQIPDTMLAFRAFLDSLPKEKADKCKLVLHTELITDAGTDLRKIKEYFFDGIYPNAIRFSHNKLSQEHLNYLYNIADVQILLTSNEGWGLTITEAMLAGTPIIANVTGGMQDQMRFEDEEGNWFVPNSDIPSNHRGTFKKHGEWAFPVYPACRSIQGSPPTPYIFDDRCRWEDATDRLKEVYNLTREERKALGAKGSEWARSKEAGFTAEYQAERVMEAFTELFNTWEPREKYEVVNATEYVGPQLKHKIIY
ncbi:glycosyltransferase [bacterium]|nr:glycosyltransferase [bacterium]